MAKDVTLDTFPSNRSEALTILYLQHQDLSGKTPQEIVELYKSTIVEVRKTFSNQSSQTVKFSGV